jgi:hypothetical protein
MIVDLAVPGLPPAPSLNAERDDDAQADLTVAWDEVSRFCDHRERAEVLWSYRDRLRDEDYWQAVAHTWEDSDRQKLTKEQWADLWLTPVRQHNRQTVMSVEERAKLQALPERVTVYRGYWWHVTDDNEVYGTNASGLSWTLAPEVAASYARRRRSSCFGSVVTGTVRRGRIIAVIDSRCRSEVVVQPKYVYNRTTADVVVEAVVAMA